MATTQRGIYYNTDYSAAADVLEDERLMAESIDDAIENSEENAEELYVKKIAGKGLSTNDFTDAYKEKVDGDYTKPSGGIPETDLADDVKTILDNAEDINNKVTELDENSTDKQYASAKATYKGDQENYKEIIKLREELEEEVNEIELKETPTLATSYHVTDSANVKMKRFYPEGHSEQVTTQGYNLINPEDLTLFSSNKYISTKNYITEGKIPIEAGQTYSIIFITSVFSDLGIYEYDENNTRTSATKTSTISGNYRILKIDFSNTAKTFGFYFGRSEAFSSLEEALKTSEIMLLKGDYSTGTLPEYEPYTNGASPNPSYEQPIESAGDNENLCDNSKNRTGYYNGGNFTVDNNYKITDFMPVTQGKTYTGSIFDKNGTRLNKAIFNTFDSNKNYIGQINNDSYTVEANVAYVTLRNLSAQSSYIINDNYAYKLEQGDKATPYSPYGMGSITEKIVNGNYLPTPLNYQETHYGVTYISNNGHISVKGNCTQSGAYGVINLENPIILPNKHLYVHLLNPNPQQYIGIRFKNGNTRLFEVTIGAGDANINKVKDIGTDYAGQTITNIEFYQNGTAVYDLDIYPMITERANETEFIEHEEQTKTYYTQQPFRSIGDVRDVFFKNTPDNPYYDSTLTLNGWYERHMPYIESYNGETLPQDVYNEIDGVKYCNEKSMSTTGQFSTGASVQYVDENNWNDLPCTEEQIQQLENRPYTYKTETNVISLDEIEAYIDFEYVQDTKTYIDNQITNLSNAIVALGGVV